MSTYVLTTLKEIDAESPPKFQVHVKMQLMRPMFPDYLSLSYDYAFMFFKSIFR